MCADYFCTKPLDDKLKGLNLSADDYITKPFHLAELKARFRKPDHTCR